MPYLDSLQNFPAYLQQLEMESNGKTVANHGAVVNYHTAPVIWGGVGCNGQHAYMQLLHQGSQIVPVDFILAAKGTSQLLEHQQLLVASCLGQSRALMLGCPNNDKLAKQCVGNRPSTTLMCELLTPKVLGSLIALYEHKVFVQGVIWHIQSFDQWGVELGKKLIGDILPFLAITDANSSMMNKVDSSTNGLINYFAKTYK